jgi:uncharacterized protein (TIGR02147 family)
VARAGEPDVFQYLDYRAFLRDWYLAHNTGGRVVSYRSFATRAQLGSPNYLKLVMDGERNLSPAMAERFATALRLEGEAASYFVDLVAFNQASTQSARNKQYARLTSFKGYRKAHRLEIAHAAYHAAWYMPAIREMASSRSFRDDPEWIGAQLTPPIARAEAQRALDTLIELGLLVRTASGKLEQSEPVLSTGAEAKGVHIVSYHRAMMERAVASIDHAPAHDRDISSITMCVGEDGIRRLKERVQRFRREILELSALEDDPVRVVQINFQVFPLSQELESEDE